MEPIITIATEVQGVDLMNEMSFVQIEDNIEGFEFPNRGWFGLEFIVALISIDRVTVNFLPRTSLRGQIALSGNKCFLKIVLFYFKHIS